VQWQDKSRVNWPLTDIKNRTKLSDTAIVSSALNLVGRPVAK
jgi:hypothetical protein